MFESSTDGDAPAYITNGSTGEKESSNRRKNKKKKKRTEKSVAAPGKDFFLNS